MRIGTYLCFMTGMVAGACLVTMNPKAKQIVSEVKEKAMQKMEDSFSASNEEQSSASI